MIEMIKLAAANVIKKEIEKTSFWEELFGIKKDPMSELYNQIIERTITDYSGGDNGLRMDSFKNNYESMMNKYKWRSLLPMLEDLDLSTDPVAYGLDKSFAF